MTDGLLTRGFGRVARTTSDLYLEKIISVNTLLWIVLRLFSPESGVLHLADKRIGLLTTTQIYGARERLNNFVNGSSAGIA